MINDKFLKSPTTMAIGDGMNDILMMQECNISFEVCESLDKIHLNSGDIITNGLC